MCLRLLKLSWFKTRVRKSPTTSTSVTSMAAAGSAPMDVEGSSQEEVSTVQVHWTPNLGCNLRIDLNTGIPEYSNYLRSTSWVPRRALRTVGDGGEVIYAKRRSRVFPENAPVSCLKITPENIPRHLGHQDAAAYFPHGEKAVAEVLEGQLAFLSHVRRYEEQYSGCQYSPAEPRLEI